MQLGNVHWLGNKGNCKVNTENSFTMFISEKTKRK